MITVKAMPLLIETSDSEINKYNGIFERVLTTGEYEYVSSALEDLVYGNIAPVIYHPMIDLRAMSDYMMIDENETERNEERGLYMSQHPDASEDEIDEYMEMVDEDLCYSRSYYMNQYLEDVEEAAIELNYCMVSDVNVIRKNDKPWAVDVTIFNCPQRNILKPYYDELYKKLYGANNLANEIECFALIEERK